VELLEVRSNDNRFSSCGYVSRARLLIPEEKLNAILKEEWVKEHPDPIPELAEEFQVSENFMRKRFEFENKKR